MIGQILGVLVVTVVYAVVTGLAAWNAMEILNRSAFLGRDHEGGKALTGLLMIFPVLWFVFFVLLFALREWPSGSLLEGWWMLAYPVGAFLIACTAFFAWALNRP